MSQPSTSEVDVVIVAYNAGDLLRGAVRSAVEQAGADHVWVMDPGSTDGSTSAIAEKVPADHLRSVPNDGFSASNNRGIELSTAPFVLLLNPDAVLGDCALATLLDTAARNPKAAVVGPAVLNPDGSVQADSFGRFPTLLSVLWLRAWRMVARLGGNRQASPKLPAHTATVDWVTGACMLVRRAAIEAVGMMDEQFFLYYEDIEWCHRMSDNGWQVLIEPAATVVHHLGGSSTSSETVERLYRESLGRYCDLYGLWGLKAVTGAGRALRGAPGGGRV